MPDKVFTAREANPPDTIIATQTDNLIYVAKDKELLFDGPQGIGLFTAWLNKSKQQGRDLIIECRRIVFRNRGGA